MGNFMPKLGRRKKTRKNGSQGSDRASGTSSEATSYYGSVYEEQMITLLRTQFTKQPHEVVLDQLLLLLPLDIDREFLEFLKGAEEGDDITLVEKASGAQLQAADVGLRAQHRHTICPDALAAAARYAVRWKAPHGPHKNQEFELLPSRLFLVQHNVAVEEHSASCWDPKPYTRLPGGGVRYVLRTEDVVSARHKKPRAVGELLGDQNRDAPPSGSVKLFVTLAPPAADPSNEGASGRFSEDSILSSSSARGEDEDVERGVGTNGADSGHESARSSEDRGLVDTHSSEEECEGGPRSPTDPLPPVPSSNDDTQHQQQESSSPYWAGLPTLPASPAKAHRNVLGPAQKQLKHVAAKRDLYAVERRLSGLVPELRAGTSHHHSQPHPLSLQRSNGTGNLGPRSSGGSSRTSEDTDYGYAGSTGSGRVPPGSTSGSLRQSPPSSVNGARARAEPLRDGEIPPQCFKDVDLKRLEVAYTEDEDAGGNPLFIRRRYLLPHAYAQAVCVPQGIETPAACIVRVALPQTEWPARLQLHWNTRKRAPATDPRTRMARQWPTPTDIDKVRSLGCLLVPNDSGDKTNNEWHYVFPAAEAYLESILSGNHIRVFLAAAALVRASTEGIVLSDGAWVQWLRHTFFWQCERDCVDMSSWERPGRALVHLLDSFYAVLMSRKLRDYFVPARNMLANADTKTICFIQERLSRARENLLVHVVGAARGLKADHTLITLPFFDFRRLHQMLTSEDFVSFLNPTLGRSLKHGGESMLQQEQRTDPGGREAATDEGDAKVDIYNDSDRESDDGRSDNDEMRAWAREFRGQLEAERAAEQLVERRPSVDSIDLKVVPPRIWDSLRRRLVLETLSEALVDRGTWAQSRGWPRLARVSARQAARLAHLLEEIVDADPAVVSDLRQRANKVQLMCNLARDTTHHDQIKVRRTSFLRLPPRSEAGNSEEADGIDEPRHIPRSVPSLTLRGTTSGESLIIVEEEETADEDDGFTNRRYSTIAEVHAELAVLRVGTTEEKSEERKVEDEETDTHKSSTDGNNSSLNDASIGERKTSNSSTSGTNTKKETTAESLDKDIEVPLETRANTTELESEKHTVSEIVSTQDTKANDTNEAVFDGINEEEEEDDLDMRL